MKKNYQIASFIVFFAIISPLNANADGQTNTLAIGGDWLAGSHSDSMTDAPDVCVAVDTVADFAFRVDKNGVEVRYGNNQWSLPDGVSGIIDIKVNSHDYPLTIASNTNNRVTAFITDDQLANITADMNVSSAMTVGAGSGPPITLSLDGSNAVITAFLTCAGKNQPGSTGGTNPFSTGTSTSQ